MTTAEALVSAVGLSILTFSVGEGSIKYADTIKNSHVGGVKLPLTAVVNVFIRITTAWLIQLNILVSTFFTCNGKREADNSHFI